MWPHYVADYLSQQIVAVMNISKLITSAGNLQIL